MYLLGQKRQNRPIHVLVNDMIDSQTMNLNNYISQMRAANSLGDSPAIGNP